MALRVNIPFSGWVKDNDEKRNRVAADLKWSSQPREHFLAAAFLRTAASLVLAYARQAGVSAGNVTFAYAYPRAFERDREDALRGRWSAVLAPPGTPESAFTPDWSGATDAQGGGPRTHAQAGARPWTRGGARSGTSWAGASCPPRESLR